MKGIRAREPGLGPARVLEPRPDALSVGEALALREVDAADHLADIDGLDADALRQRLLGTCPDALRVRPPARPARNQRELVGRVARLVDRLANAPHVGIEGEERARAVAAMLGALATLDRIHAEIEGARRAGRAA